MPRSSDNWNNDKSTSDSDGFGYSHTSEGAARRGVMSGITPTEVSRRNTAINQMATPNSRVVALQHPRMRIMT